MNDFKRKAVKQKAEIWEGKGYLNTLYKVLNTKKNEHQ